MESHVRLASYLVVVTTFGRCSTELMRLKRKLKEGEDYGTSKRRSAPRSGRRVGRGGGGRGGAGGNKARSQQEDITIDQVLSVIYHSHLLPFRLHLRPHLLLAPASPVSTSASDFHPLPSATSAHQVLSTYCERLSLPSNFPSLFPPPSSFPPSSFPPFVGTECKPRSAGLKCVAQAAMASTRGGRGSTGAP